MRETLLLDVPHRQVVVAFITEYAAVDRIIDHLKLTFVAEKPISIRGKDYLLSICEGKC